MDKKITVVKQSASSNSGFVPGTMEERLSMVWPLTYEAVSLGKKYNAEQRLQRHIVILLILSENKVKFLLVGAYAMAVHGYPRATMDIDIWVKPDEENASLVLKALAKFGAPIGDLTQKDFQTEDIVFQIGVMPRRIDILTSVSGLEFEDAFSRSCLVDIEGIPIHVLSIPDLIANKKVTGRTKDLADVEVLEDNL